MKKILAPFFLLFFVTACGSLGLPSPETVPEKIIAAESSFQIAVKSATEAKKVGLISVEAESVMDLAIDGANTSLRAAKEQYRLGAPLAAEDYILRALSYVADINRLVERAQEL